MVAILEQLIEIRSQLVEEVLVYLDALAERMAALPSYYPAHLRTDERGQTRFDAIRQMVQVMEDRSALEQWRAEERERLRRAGLAFDRLAYDPTRARPELDERDRRDTKRPKPPPPPVPWDEYAGERFKRATILGDPGFGKTWLLRYEARRLAREAARQLRERQIGLADLILPLFARLSEVNQHDDPLEDTLVALAGTGCSETFRHFIREKLQSERCVVLLDAWDEVPVEVPSDGHPIRYATGFRQRLGQRLEAFARQFPQLCLLLTSRIVGYTPSPLPNVQELELLAFDLSQTEAFVQVWFGDDSWTTSQFLTMLRQHHQVRGLARIPLMLALLCRAYQEQHLSFPTRRVELYDRCLRGLLRDWKAEKDYAISEAYVEAILELLRVVGYTLFVEGYEQFKESNLRRKIEEWLDGLKHTHELYHRNPASLIAELKRDGILITAGEGSEAPLLFLHRTFHEYLAAQALAQQANREGWPAIANIVDKKAWLPGWQEVIILLAGQLRNPKPFLELLADKKKDDYFRHRLGLAVLCLPECISTDHNPKLNLVDHIASIAFEVWWDHEAAGRGQVVEHLSRGLPALAQVNSQVEGEPLLTLLCKKYLHDPEADVRGRAAEALGQMGGAAAQPEMLPTLLATLHDLSEYVRGRAAKALGRMGGAAAQPQVLSALLAVLHDPKWSVQVYTVEALGQMGGAAAQPQVLSALLAVLHDSDEAVRERVANTLGRMGGAAAQPQVLSALLATLHDPGGHVRESSVWALGQMRVVTQPQVLSALLAILHDPEWYVRARTAEALGQMRVATQTQVLSALLTALHDPKWSVRRNALEALGRMGTVTQPQMLSALLAALHDPEAAVRESAAKALGQVGAAAAQPEVLLALLAALHDPEAAVRESAAKALGQMGAAAAQPEVVSALVATLHEPEAAVRWSAKEALRQMGAAAAQPEAFSALLAALHDSKMYVRVTAAEVLGQIGVAAAQPQVLSALLVILHEPDRYVRERAMQALGQMGAAAAQPQVLSALLAALHNPVGSVRGSAAKALGQMRAAAQPQVLSALLNALHDPDKYVRESAAAALGQIGVAAAQPQALSTLLAALHDPDGNVRGTTLETLGQIGVAAAQPQVLSALLAALHDPNEYVSGRAAVALGQMGAATAQPEVLSALLAALHDPDKYVRRSAATALGKITQEVRIFRRWLGKMEVKGVNELANP